MRDPFSGIVDYAGLFPPATCSMVEAVEGYRSYRDSSDRWMLGRFVIGAGRLDELASTLEVVAVSPPAGDPWRLSVVLGANVPDDLAHVEQFRSAWNARGVIIDSIECKVSSPGQVQALAQQIPDRYLRHLEVPIEGPYRALVESIGAAGAAAKVRTGGTTPELFPTPESLTQFLLAVTRVGVAFKATAGLHHPIRGAYPLTYAPDATRHLMYGFINVLLATAELARGGDGETAQAILEDADHANFSRDADGMQWRALQFSNTELHSVRSRFFLGFGSCSFREPVDELSTEVPA